MSRILPRSLTAQLLVLLAAALIAANVAALFLLSSDRREAVRQVQRRADLERVAALVPALALLDDGLRERVVRASSRRFLHLDLARMPIVREQHRSGNLEARFEDETGTALDDVRIALLSAPGAKPFRPSDGRRREKFRAEILVSVRLPDGIWLNARLDRPRRTSDGTGLAVLVALGLSLATVLAVAVLFLRRITGPIRALTEAARRAGHGDRTALAPVSGANETREAAEAFNAMQAAIARFDAERARIVAAVGHDLRTPITSLRIRAEMLDDDQREPMVRILDEMRVMADGLLAWSRGEAESEELDAVDLAALLRELCENTAEPAAPAAHYDGPEHLMIRGRPVALRRAFANLVDNACRYGGGGTVRLTSGNPVIVTIEDDGPGVPEDRIEQIFEPFARGEASRSVETGGTGLGLSITRTIVRAHGGTLSLVNRSEGGLRVTVEIPNPQAAG